MRIRVGCLRRLIEIVSQPDVAAERLVTHAIAAVKDPRKRQRLVNFMSNTGVDEELIDMVVDVIRGGNRVELVAVIRDVACVTFGVRPSSTGSGSHDYCDSGMTKRGLEKLAAAG